MHRWFKGKLVVGLAALAVIAFAGGAIAATVSSGPTSRQAFLNDVAKRLHVTPQQLSSALNGASIDQLQAAVKAGQLTQAQANAIEQRMKQNGNVTPPPFGFFGPGGPGGPIPRLRLVPAPYGGPAPYGVPAPYGGPGPWGGQYGAPRPFGLGPFAAPSGFSGAGRYLGLTGLQLFQQLSSGKSLAQIATARGKSVSGLEQAMTAAVKSTLDKLLAAKAITAAQERQLLSAFSARLSREVNQKGLPLPRLQRGTLRPRGVPPRPGAGAPPPTIAPTSPYAPPAPIA